MSRTMGRVTALVLPTTCDAVARVPRGRTCDLDQRSENRRAHTPHALPDVEAPNHTSYRPRRSQKSSRSV
jgi:hypothetical protein